MSETIEQIDATLMFTDIVGYSKLMGKDQSLTITMVEEYRAILHKEIENHQGIIVEFIGDAVFARFDTPEQGINAAVAIQKAIFTYNHFRDKQLPELHTRIGLHCGKAAIKNGALFGDNVNITARLEPIAYADGICLSEAMYKAITSGTQWPTLSLGIQPLKNIESRIRVWLIRPAGISYKVRLHYWNQKINRNLGVYRHAIAGFFILLLAAAWYFVPRILVPGYDANYVEITEFENAMPDNSQWGYLKAGITEDVRSQLADMRNIYVVDSGKGIQAPVILEGSIQRMGDNIRIAYRLLRRDGMVQIAGGKLDGAFNEIFILEDRLVAEIARYLSEEFGIEYLRPAKLQVTSSVTAYDYYLQGLEYLSKPTSHENSDKAINLFSTALVHDSNFALAEAGLCQAYRKKFVKTIGSNWLSNAEDHCKKALALEPDLPKAIESMGLIYSEQGRHEDAIKMLSDVLSRNPDNMQASMALADVYSEIDEYPLAVTTIEKAIALQPKNWEGYHMLGYLYLTNNQLKKAVDSYKQVLQFTPNNSTALNNLGVSYMYLGEFSKARKYYQAAVRMAPNAWGYSNVGLMDYFNRDYLSASKMFEKAIELSPEDYHYYSNLADTLQKIPYNEEKAKHYYLSAIPLIENTIKLNPNDAVAFAYLANAQFNLNKKDEALNSLQEAIALKQEDLDVLSIKARIEIEMKEFKKAQTTIKTMLELGYDSVLVMNDPDFDELMQKDKAGNALASE